LFCKKIVILCLQNHYRMPVDIQTGYNGIIIRLRNENESIMFPSLVKEALQKIASRPMGHKLLNNIAALSGRAKFGYTVCIRRPANMSIVNGNYCRANLAVRANEADAKDRNSGTVTVIDFNANITLTPDGPRPTFIGLAHELIHAYYNLKGKGINGPNEEYATVGIAPGPKRSITENGIRAEHNVPLRETYVGL
jgi:hypothetical protein